VNLQCQQEVFTDFFDLLRFAIGRARIAGPIVLAQYKGNERIGKAHTPICHALPLVTEMA
jgi:hypothetical protein